jgi:hypothetical protein
MKRPSSGCRSERRPYVDKPDVLRDRDLSAFGRILEKRIEALVLTPGPLFNNNRVQLATLAARQNLKKKAPGRA